MPVARLPQPVSPVSTTVSPGVERTPFGTLPGGEAAELFVLRNASGAEVRVTGYGGVIVSVRVPDRQGRLGDVVLGHDTLAGYVADDAYFGALIGRCANRIRGGRFVLDGTEHALPVNNGANHLHGGPRGFHKHAWAAETRSAEDGAAVVLTRTSPDGEEGYPGTVQARVTYRWTDRCELVVDYEAETDRATPVNLTQHTYFNLSADATRDVLGHVLRIAAEGFTPVDATLIPTGEIAPVAGTPFDFRTPLPIGARVEAADEQLAHAGGYDHNFVLVGEAGALKRAARVHDAGSGRTLELHTTEPGVQFYSGNFLDGSVVGKGGVAYAHRTAFCLEPQHFPDAPNQPAFPSVILRPGQRYASRTVYRFGVE